MKAHALSASFLAVMCISVQAKGISLRYGADYDSVSCGSGRHPLQKITAVTYEESIDFRNYAELKVERFHDFQIEIAGKKEPPLWYFLQGRDGYIKYFLKGRVVETIFIYGQYIECYKGESLQKKRMTCYRVDQCKALQSLLRLRYEQLPPLDFTSEIFYTPLNSEEMNRYREFRETLSYP